MLGPQRANPKSLSAVKAEVYQSRSLWESRQEALNLILEMCEEKKMEPYLGVIYVKPTPKEIEDGGVEKIVLEPVCVMADDPSQAAIKVMTKVPKEFADSTRLVVRVLRFH